MNPIKMRRTRLTQIAVLCAVFTLLGVLWFAGEGLASEDAITSLDGSVKIASPDSVSPGGQVLYSIILDNDSTSTGQVIVGDMMPAEISTISNPAVDPPGSALFATDYATYITFTVPSVATNSVITLTFEGGITVEAQTGELITNTAVISYDGNMLERSVTIEVAEAPISKFDVPWNNQVILGSGDFVISGRAWTADQNPNFPDTPVLEPINYVDQPGGGYYFVEWTGVPGALSYVLQESPDETFYLVNQVFPGSGDTNWLFNSNPPGTYYYRIKSLNAVGSSFWSNVESVTVLASNIALQIDNMLTPAASRASYQPVVEVNIKKAGDPDGPWYTADVEENLGGWWNWTYIWTLPIETDAQQYVLQTRAKDLVGNYDPTKMDTITVTLKNGYVYLPLLFRDADLHPYAPVLNIDSDDGQGNYALSWVYNYSFPMPTVYRFQEATDPAFTTLTIDEIRSSPQTFTNQALGTYYYRVRGENSYGPGPWSNNQTILVEEKGFFDDFSNPSSGWLTGLYDATDSPAQDVIDFAYVNNEYRMWIKVATDGSHNEKTGTVAAPYDNTASTYTVEVDQHWTEAADVSGYPPMNSKAALIFAATDDYSRIYSVEWNFEGKCKVWRNWEVSPPVDGVDIYHSDTFYQWNSNCNAHSGYNKTNHVKVEVSGTSAAFYMNGVQFTTINTSELGSLHDVGLIVGSWDWTPVDSRYDNFRVTLP